MDLLIQGLTLSLTGLVITFASLGLFILIIILLQRLFGPEEDQVNAGTEETSASRTITIPTDPDHETAAVIAIAIEYFRSLETEPSGVGAVLSQGKGPWWHTRQFPAEPTRQREKTE